jgi:hypothetical protein
MPPVDEDDFVGDVLPPVVEPAVPVRLDRFQPWHKPRKQLVRRNQWCALASRLITTLKAQGELTFADFRYLTLPGIDLLDVEMLAQVCSAENLPLTFTGFLAAEEGTPARARAHFRESVLKDRGAVTNRSQLLYHRFEEIAPEKTQASKTLRQRGPFHIVNVDACGPLALHDGKATRIIDSIYRIVEYQLSATASPWLLFVTTIVQRDSISDEVLTELTEIILENAARHPDFGATAQSALDATAQELAETLTQAARQDGPDLLKLFSMGLGKWLVLLAEAKGWYL